MLGRKPPYRLGDALVQRRIDIASAPRRPTTAPGGVSRARDDEWIRLHDELMGRPRFAPPNRNDVAAARRVVEAALRSGDLVARTNERRFRGVETWSLGVGAVDETAVPGPSESPETTWFEATVVDAALRPVSGLDVVLSASGERREARTNGAGQVRFEGLAASTGMLKIRNVALTREALARLPPASPAARDDDSLALVLGRDDLTAPLEAKTPRRLVLVQPLARVRLIGMHFDTNKAFLRESAMRGIRKVVEAYERSPHGKLLVVGHTDTAGTDDYNVDLSVERAEAVSHTDRPK